MEKRLELLKELISYLQEDNFSKVLEIFNILDQTDDIEIQKENNLYLYLLSYIKELPSEYRERVLNIKSEDLLLKSDNDKYKDITIQNKIIISIMRAKFNEAKELIEQSKELENKKEKELLLLLVKLANAEEIKVRTKIEWLVKNKQYEILVDYLTKRNRMRKLSLYESYVYAITRTILRIKETNKIPRVLDENPENFKKAIMGYNFKMALLFNRKDMAIKYEESKYIISLLLIEINNLIDSILKEAREKIELERRTSISNIKKIKEELIKGNIELSLNLIKEYLKNKNNEDYLYLIEKLIKISLLKKDLTYKKVLDVLEAINNSNYTFDIKYFYSEFHNHINRNEFSLAEIYLDIIKYYQPNHKEEFSDEELNKIITMLESNKEEKEFLLSELRELEKDNQYIKVFKKIPHKRRKILIRIANSIKNLSAVSTGIKEPKNLVIRRINPDLKTGKEKDLMNEALNFYINKEYNMSMLLYMRLLTSMDYINTKVCEMLGLSFLHLNEKEEALKYLKLSKQFVKNFQANKNGIDKLIDLLEKEPSEETNKKINDFLIKYDSEVINFDIEKLESIANHMKENNMTIEEGIEKFELAPQQVLIIKLIYARYYYMEGMIISGDRLLQEVEKTKQKIHPVITMLNEIRENKQFYQNRKENYTRKKII